MPRKKQVTSTEPRTLQQAIAFFHDEDDCLAYLVARRWPKGVACPTCGNGDVLFLKAQRRWKCKSIHPRRQFSVKVGTVMEDSPVPLSKWLPAMWMIANCKNGISSYEIHRALDITQKSAWFMLHRVRLAMQDGQSGGMSGEVEADESYVGGKLTNMHRKRREAKTKGTGMVGKAIVMGILNRSERKTKEAKKKRVGKPSAVRATVIPDAKRATIEAQVLRHSREFTSYVVHNITGIMLSPGLC